MSTVKFINEIIRICFSARTFQFKVYQYYPYLSLVMEFWEIFSLFSFLKNFFRMKHWWWEELQLPATIKRSFLSGYKWQKLFERYAQLRLFPKQILYQSYFTFQIIFTKWILFFNSFKCVSDGNVWPSGQRAELRERIASESLQKTHTTFYEVAGHVGRVKTVVTNHLRKMFRSRIHKAAECNTTVRIN